MAKYPRLRASVTLPNTESARNFARVLRNETQALITVRGCQVLSGRAPWSQAYIEASLVDWLKKQGRPPVFLRSLYQDRFLAVVQGNPFPSNVPGWHARNGSAAWLYRTKPAPWPTQKKEVRA